jgi:hypothetical protein
MRAFLVALLVFLSGSPAFAWGQIGHRVTGAIGEPLLSKKAAKAVKAVLGTESLAEASTWPDEMRSSPEVFWQKTANPWHYVTIPMGQTYSQVGAPPEGDAISALKGFAVTLRDPNARLEDKQLALRFTIHIIGDLHQPLHVGNGTDRGGNDFKVQFGREETNLHAVWDGNLIDRQQLSYTEMTAWLNRRITPQNLEDWANPDPLVWVAESAELRDKIYPADTKLSYSYAFQQNEALDTRLMQAGVRVAAYLNELYK